MDEGSPLVTPAAPFKAGDEVMLQAEGSWYAEHEGHVVHVSDPFRSGNWTEADGTPILVRELHVLVPVGEDDTIGGRSLLTDRENPEVLLGVASWTGEPQHPESKRLEGNQTEVENEEGEEHEQ